MGPARVLMQGAVLVVAMVVGVGGSLAVAGETNAGAWSRFEELWPNVPHLFGSSKPAESAPLALREPWFHVFVRGVLERNAAQLKIAGEQYETPLAVEYNVDFVIERSSSRSPSVRGTTTH